MTEQQRKRELCNRLAAVYGISAKHLKRQLEQMLQGREACARAESTEPKAGELWKIRRAFTHDRHAEQAKSDELCEVLVLAIEGEEVWIKPIVGLTAIIARSLLIERAQEKGDAQ